MEVVKPGGTLLTVTEHGYGKRTEIDEYRVQSRGGVGVINIATSERNGHVVGVAYVQEGDELLLITQQGMILRMQTNDVRAIGRATQGVRLIDIEGDDRVVSIARLVEKEDPDAPDVGRAVLCRLPPPRHDRASGHRHGYLRAAATGNRQNVPDCGRHAGTAEWQHGDKRRDGRRTGGPG